MNDIERLLQRGGNHQKPHRALRPDFTDYVLEQIEVQHAHKHGLGARVRQIFAIKFVHKPALLAFAVVTIMTLGGTAYATNGFGFLNAVFKDEYVLANGDRIVQVDTKNCVFVDSVTILKERNDHASYYYKVKKDSKLTNKQITQMVQGKCDLEKAAAATPNIMNELVQLNPANKDRVVGGYIDSEVLALNGSDITLRMNIPFVSNDELEVRAIARTFALDPQAIVVNGSERLRLQDLKVGDRLSFNYRASGEALTHSETIAPDKVNPAEQVVVALYKNPPTVTAAIDFDKYYTRDFERVEPCRDDASKYCSLAEYHTEK